MKRLALIVALASTSLQPLLAGAQTPVMPPDTGLLVSYQYWPTQYVQWVGAELPYSMIELDVDPAGKQPVLYVSLTDRATGKRVHYTNSDAMVGMAKGMGEEAHKTEIAYEGTETENPGSVTSLRFSLADGKPLQWRFVQGSDISEQGSGLTALGEAKIPIFAYREQGAVAGEGTALQIGDVTSAAEVWKEISHPPYFVGYRGALTQNAHMLVFLPGKQSWTITASPKALAAGNAWELDSERGDHRTVRIDKVDGPHFGLSGSDRFAPGVRFFLDAVRTGDAWAIERVRYAPVREGEKHFVALQFAAPLTGDGKSELSIMAGKKKTIATGTVSVAGSPADHTETLAFATPEWAKDKRMTEQTTVSGGAVTIVAHP